MICCIFLILIAVIFLLISNAKVYIKRPSKLIFGVTCGILLLGIICAVLNFMFPGTYLGVFGPPVLLIVGAILCISFYSALGKKDMATILEHIYESGTVLDRMPEGPVVPVKVLTGQGNDGPNFDVGKNGKPIHYSKIKVSNVWDYYITVNKLPRITHQFRYLMSDTANADQYNKLISELNEIVSEDTWYWGRDGRWINLHAIPKGKNHPKVSLDSIKTIDSILPWYLIPLGAVNPMNSKTISSSMRMWKLHDVPEMQDLEVDLAIKRGKTTVKEPSRPKLGKGLTYQQLLNTPEMEGNMAIRFDHSSSAAIYPGNKGVWSVLSHILASKKVQVYVMGVNEDLAQLNGIYGVSGLASSIPQEYEIAKRMMYIMAQRYNALERLDLKFLPVNGALNLGTRVVINNYVLKANERVHIRIVGDERDIVAQDVQPGMEIVMEGNKNFRIPTHWEFINNESIQVGGVNYPPVMVVVNDPSKWLVGGNINPDDEIAGISNQMDVPQEYMLNEIRNALNLCVEHGRAVNMHIIFSGEIDDESLPVSLRDLISLRMIPYGADNGIKNLLMLDKNVPDEDNGLDLMYNVNWDEMSQFVAFDPGVNGFKKFIGAKVDKKASSKSNSKTTSKSKSKPAKNSNKGKGKDVADDPKPVKQESVYASDNPYNLPQLQIMRFERYDGTPPNRMPHGVLADYGMFSEKREKSEIKDGQTVKVGNRDIVLNSSSRVKKEEVVLDDVKEDKEIALPVIHNYAEEEQTAPADEGVVTLESFLMDVPDVDPLDDEGRVDKFGDVTIVGDNSSLNSFYSEVVDDEADPYHIVK